MHTAKDESGQVLKLAGKLDIRVAQDLKIALQDFIAEKADCLLDLSGVETCDTATLQLLVSARKTVESAGGRFVLSALPEPVLLNGALLGLSFELAPPGGCPAPGGEYEHDA